MEQKGFQFGCGTKFDMTRMAHSAQDFYNQGYWAVEGARVPAVPGCVFVPCPSLVPVLCDCLLVLRFASCTMSLAVPCFVVNPRPLSCVFLLTLLCCAVCVRALRRRIPLARA